MFELFRGCHLIQIVPVHHPSVQHPFPTVLSLQWALTHRSFSRILPDSSNFPRSYSQFFPKSDVRMFSISQMLFQDQFLIISLLAQPLCFPFSRSISVISVVFLVVFLSFEDRRSFSSCPFSRSFVVLVSCYRLELFRL